MSELRLAARQKAEGLTGFRLSFLLLGSLLAVKEASIFFIGIYVIYLYHCGVKDMLCLMFGYLVVLFFAHPSLFALAASGIVLIWLFEEILVYFHFDGLRLSHLPLLIQLAMVLTYLHWDLASSFVLLVVMLYLHALLLEDVNWVKKWHIPHPILAITLLQAGYLILGLFPQFRELLALAVVLVVLFLVDEKSALVVLVWSHFFASLVPLPSLIYLFLLRQVKNHVWMMNLILLASVFYIDISQGIPLAFIFALSNLLRWVELPCAKKTGIHVEINQVQLLKRKFNHFAHVFELLGNYYRHVNSLQADLLDNMANALRYTDTCFNHIKEGNLQQQVLDYLSGYKYEVLDCQISESDEGFIDLKLTMRHFVKAEIYDTLIPLLNHVLPTKMEFEGLVYQKNGSACLDFHSVLPCYIDAYADSLSLKEACGDAFSIFRHSAHVMCMICDGMGSGEQASLIANSCTQIFQHLIGGGMNYTDALNSMNHLLQDDNFSTVDLCSFDRYKKTLTICKSAACPSYLIRNHEIYEINGNSLPLGIIASIEVDQMTIEVEKDDWYIMCSDGIYVDELVRFMGGLKCQNAHEAADMLMDILKEQKRKDDSTFLIAHVV